MPRFRGFRASEILRGDAGPSLRQRWLVQQCTRPAGEYGQVLPCAFKELATWMNYKAMEWVFKHEAASSTQKLLLITLAYHVNVKGLCWPSIATLERETQLNRKTVIAGIKALIEAGHIADTGERAGGTDSVKVYQWLRAYSHETVPEAEPLSSTVFTRSSTENGTPKQYQKRTEAVPFLRRSSTENGTQNNKRIFQEYSPLTPQGGEGEDIAEPWEPEPVEPMPPVAARPPSKAAVLDAKCNDLLAAFRHARLGKPLSDTVPYSFRRNFQQCAAALVKDGVTPEQVIAATRKALAQYERPDMVTFMAVSRNIDTLSVSAAESSTKDLDERFGPAPPKMTQAQIRALLPEWALRCSAPIDEVAH